MNDKVLTATSRLRRGALVLQGMHLLITSGGIARISYLWAWALTGLRGRTLNPALVMLPTQGAGSVAGHEGCALGPWHIRVSSERFGPRGDRSAQIEVSRAFPDDDGEPVGAADWSSSARASR